MKNRSTRLLRVEIAPTVFTFDSRTLIRTVEHDIKRWNARISWENIDESTKAVQIQRRKGINSSFQCGRASSVIDGNLPLARWQRSGRIVRLYNWRPGHANGRHIRVEGLVGVQTCVENREPHRHFGRHRRAVGGGNIELRCVTRSPGANRDWQCDFPISLGNPVQVMGIEGCEVR
ncbi:hypothetical protein D3C87_1373610 [compost metagenome]